MASLVQLIVPQPCFDEFFVNFNLFHVACLKIVISKCLGYGIIAGSLLVKVPQILKIRNSGSAEGLSIVSSSLELTALTGGLCYSWAKSFPFSTYGEAAFLILQTSAIAFLILSCTVGRTFALTYISVYAGLLGVLLSPLAPMELLWYLQAAVMPLVVLARMIQALTNYRNSSTGQLSAITVGLLFAGSVARVFTSMQETGDSMIILTFVVSSLCNAVIVGQLCYYWNSVANKTTQPRAKRA